MRHRINAWLFAALVGAIGCGGSASGESVDTFVADNLGDLVYGDQTTNPSTGNDDNGDGDDGALEIIEADIVVVEGDRIYALSQYAGLTIVDGREPESPFVLGRWRGRAKPLEMYVEAGQVFMLLSESGDYAWDEAAGGWTWHDASRMVALDTSIPAAIEVTGVFEVPGTIVDSRRMGDVLYLATYETGGCWGCGADDRTVVTSFDIADPASIAVVDQLSLLTTTSDAWGSSGPRSMSAGLTHLYLGGIDYGDGNVGSVIDVVDISDPGGTLAIGAKLQIAGAVASRWQIDERDTVLRVLTQPGTARGWEPASPVLQTWSIGSSEELVPLGALTLVLPRPEDLHSVRFEGDRAYAVTSEPTDPLITIDLSDPSAPVQRGMVEMSGAIHHMEARGDRLLAVGIDQGNPDGALSLSLFDTTDLAAPSLLSQVAFGGDWGSFAEDQNRMHKGFTVLDELGLVAIPFSGWHASDEPDGCSTYASGIQLVDWQADELALRGIAPAHGRPRRALVHREHLIGISDNAFETFAITDRDAPVKTGSVALATDVQTVAICEDHVARLSNDPWTRMPVLEIVPSSAPTSAEPLGRLDLSSLVKKIPYECYDATFASAQLFVEGDWVYILRDGPWDTDAAAVLDVIDITDAAVPTLVDTIELPALRGHAGAVSILGLPESNAVQQGEVIVYQHDESITAENGETILGRRASFEVIALGTGAPEHVASIARPDGIAHGGMQIMDREIVSWHMREAEDSGVRFFFDRVHIDDPQNPAAMAPVNVPGVPIAWDLGTGHLVTVDHQLESVDRDRDACVSKVGHGWDEDASACMRVHRELHRLEIADDLATLLDSLAIEGEDGELIAAAASADRTFVQIARGLRGSDLREIVVLGGIGTAPLAALGTLALTPDMGYGMQADRTSLVIHGRDALTVIDASDAAAPTSTPRLLAGWGCSGLTVKDGVAYCPLGAYGLDAFAL